MVVGERRWRAAVLAGLDSIECVVIAGNPSAEDILEDQLVENAVRLDNKPVEQARAYRRLMDAKRHSHRDLAERLSVDHGTVTRALALLNLPAPIQESVDAGEIRPQTAYELSRVEDASEQAQLADEARAGRLKRDEIRDRVAAGKPRASKATATKGKGANAKVVKLRAFKTAAGAKVTVERGKGLDPSTVLAALEEAAAKVRAEVEGQGGQDAA